MCGQGHLTTDPALTSLTVKVGRRVSDFTLLFIMLEVCSLLLCAQDGFELCIFPCVTEAGVGLGILIESLIMVITMTLNHSSFKYGVNFTH